MRFDIDYSHSKTMATRLQDFLSASPKKLSRSSAIEAVAQMLGFNNRNEMAARLDASAPEPVEAPSAREAALDALNTLRMEEIEACAKALVDLGLKYLPEGDFRAAMHTEVPEGYSHVLMVVEDDIVQSLLADPQRRSLLSGIFCESEEMEGARQEGLDDLPSLLARTLVNESYQRAEALWDEMQD